MAQKTTKSFLCSGSANPHAAKTLFISNNPTITRESLHTPSSATSLFFKSALVRPTASHRTYATSKLRPSPNRSYLTQKGPESPFLNLSYVPGCKSLSGIRSFHSSAPTASKQEDFYDLLGVSRTATQDELKRAYHKLAMKYHPDKNPGDKSAEEKLQKINQAYSILKDEEKRRQYDQFGSAAFDGGAGFDPSEMGMNMQDMLSELFNMNFGGGKGQQAKSRGDDVELPLRITFKEAVTGCEKVVSFTAKTSCSTCHGSGAQPGTSPKTCSKCQGRGFEVFNQGYIPIQTTCRTCNGEGTVIATPCSSCKGKGVVNAPRKVSVQIPAGVDDGMSIRLVNQGDAGVKGGRAGHLYIKLSVPPDEVFKREGSNVHTDVPISLSQAVLGGTVMVPTLTGTDVEIRIPPGTQPDEKRVLRGKGIPAVSPDGRGTKAGNQYIHFKIKIPTNLTPRQKEAMEKFALDEKPEDVRRYARENPGNPYANTKQHQQQQQQQQQQWRQRQSERPFYQQTHPHYQDDEDESEEGNRGDGPFRGWHSSFEDFFRRR